MTIRDKISEIIGQYIEPDGWDTTFKELNTQGWMDTKTMQQIVIELCKRIERMENGANN